MTNRSRFFGRTALRRPAFAGAMLILTLGGGPATAELTLDEALEVADELTTAPFRAPPRSIADITRLLDQYRPSPSAETVQRIRRADGQPPDTRKPGKLVKFYVGRGKARRALGRTEEALEDLLQAAQYLKHTKMGPKRRKGVLAQLAYAQANAGRLRRSALTMRRVLSIGQHAGAYRLLVEVLGAQGDLDGMEEARRSGKALIEKRRSSGQITYAQDIALRIEYLRIEHAAHRTLGRWDEAEKALRLAIAYQPKSTRSASGPSWLAARRRELANLLIRQGRLAEAEAVTRKALLDSLELLGRGSGTTADTLRSLANAIHAQGRYDEAEILVREAIGIQTRMGVPAGSRKLAKSRRTLIGILVALENWEEAVLEYDALNSDSQRVSHGVRRMLLKRPDAAIALLQVGREAEAVRMLEDAVARSRERLGEKHFETALQTGFLAAARTHMGDFDRALVEFARSVPILLSRSRQADEGADEGGDATSVGRQITFVLEAYIHALTSGTPTDARIGDAFRIAEAARGQAVQQALGESGARAAANDPELAELARSEQDARRQIGTLFTLLSNVLGTPPDDRDESVVGALRERIDKLREARGALMKRIEEQFPEYASLVDPKPATVESARATLRPDEALITTYVGTERTFVWAVPKRGEMRFVAVDMGREDIADLVGLVRSALEPNVSAVAEIPAFDVDIAYGLYQQLLEPVRAAWSAAKRLVVAVHGPLGHLPLSVLPTARGEPIEKGAIAFAGYREVAWLARTHSVTVVPSVASLTTLRSLPSPTHDGRAFLGIGDPVFDWSAERATLENPPASAELLAMRSAPAAVRLDDAALRDLPALPDTLQELRAIASSMGANPDRSVLVGAQATEERVKQSRLDGFRVIAFATHGLTPGDLGGLTEPALALTAPREGSVGEDGLLTMSEILGLELDAEWVVLSACNTASGAGAGAEAISGLGRAFFYAGSRALLVSSWPIETTSARALTTGLFRRQATRPELPRAEALRQAMLELIDRAGQRDTSGKLLFSYAHPLFWAPFSLIGDGD